MKLYLLAFLAVVTSATFLDFLRELQSHSSFQRLPEEEKLLFGQLVLAAEYDELAEFIDRTGLIPVLKLMDHMSHSDAEKFAAYLAEHSNYTHHAPDHTDVINKRDDDHHHHLHSLTQLLHDRYYSSLPATELNTLNQLAHAAQTQSLTDLLSTIGYGPVFGLMEQLNSDHSYQLSTLLQNALAKESQTVARVARQSHHSNFYNYLQGLNSRYYEGLPEEERQVYHDLLDATQNKTLTQYIANNGYGPIFGFIEHLDSWHANQAYDYIAKALEDEKAANSA